MGCARTVGVGCALAVAVASMGPSWNQVPVDVEDSTSEPDVRDAQTNERSAIEAILAEKSNLPAASRARVARAIVEESAEAKLDPVFVLAVMGVESELNGQAVSRRGARGLMQLRNATTLYLGEKEQLGLGPETTDDPALNVRVGIRYLHRLNKAFNDLSVALIAYNAGPHRISGYLKTGRIPDRFLEYPRRVKGHYRRLLGQLADGSLRIDKPLHIRVAAR